MIADAILAVYDNCKPHPNWIRATKKKVWEFDNKLTSYLNFKATALKAFEAKAEAGGCTIE